MVFITLVLGMLDLGLGVFHYNMLAQIARQGARRAIVHGSMADQLGVWGPDSYSGTGSDGSPIAQELQSSLPGFNLSEVSIQVDWIGGNEVTEDHHVCVTVTRPYQPIMTFIFGNPTITLQASSTMAIAH